MARVLASSNELCMPIDGWSWLTTKADAVAGVDALPRDAEWMAAIVPGTVGAMLRREGRLSLDAAQALDSHDYWYRAKLDAALNGVIRFEGLATICEIFIGGVKRAESRSMFQPIDIPVDMPAGTEIVLCFRALAARLAQAPRRARWRPGMIQPNGLRWFRTSVLGSMPGWCPPGRPVGPWRPIETLSRKKPDLNVKTVDVRTSYDGEQGIVDVTIDLAGSSCDRRNASIRCGTTTAPLVSKGPACLTGRLVKVDAQPWFPHTHGKPSLYPLQLAVDEATIDLGHVGFRSLVVDRGSDGKGFGLIVNGVPVFCRGACWSSADVTAMPGSRAAYEPWLRLARDAGMNMIRVGGTMTYESDTFFALCDELGLLVWQDMMLANFDYPQDDVAFRAALDAEARGLLDRTQTSPSLAVLCGGSEVFQQAAMLGAPADAWSGPIFDTVLPQAVADLRPDIAYVPNSPSGGSLPFVANEGVTHYFGVGAYKRPLDDARRANVRFASECLAFANLPEEASLRAADLKIGDGDWKVGVPRDAGVDWDFEDVRDHYLELLYGVTAAHLRVHDPDRYAALSRAAVAEVMEETFAEWRRPGSSARGALVFLLQDLQPGAGWGVIASDGTPKSAWHALKRAFRPVQVAVTDEGVNGLALHVINERAHPLDARLTLMCWRDGKIPVAKAEREIHLDPRTAISMSAYECLGRFFDISYAYRFGPAGHDVTSVTLQDPASGIVLAEAFHFPLGRGQARDARGLQARLEQYGNGWSVAVSTDLFAQSVHIVDDNWQAAENWFHLSPDMVKHIALEPRSGSRDVPPSGSVCAINACDVAFFGEADPGDRRNGRTLSKCLSA
jgi:beta-mannosidase